MFNTKSRRSLGQTSITKAVIAGLLQKRFSDIGVEVSVDKAQSIFESVLEEIKLHVRNGRRVHVKDFGEFYPKKMKRRKVVGGILPESYETPYVVPAKTKIGFSSTPTGDTSVSRRS